VNRQQRLRELLAADQQLAPSRTRIELICDRCVTELTVTGAGATVLSKNTDSPNIGHRRGLVHASNPTSARLEDLQLTVGEGPCVDAFASGGPILVSDLAADVARWPAFGSAAVELGAAAVFSFPLQVGVVRLGSLDLYRDEPGELSGPAFTTALILADLATLTVIEQIDGHTIDDVTWLADSHTEIHQAVGMVRIQLGVSSDTALLRLRGYAFTHGLALAEVARRVVSRTLLFDADEEVGHEEPA
jgi:hypothetical protein